MQKILIISVFLSIGLVYGQAHKKSDSTFTHLNKALRHPEKVKVLDLRGKKLSTLPAEIGKMKNMEVLLLGEKLRNLALYPPAWPYLHKKKTLPAGGYAHLQGRGGGKFYIFNHLTTLPVEILSLKNLKIIDIDGNRLDENYWRQQLQTSIPGIQVMCWCYENTDKSLDEISHGHFLLKYTYGFDWND